MLSLLVGRDRLADTNSILILVSTCSLHAICVIPFDRCGPWMHTFQIDQIRWRAARRARAGAPPPPAGLKGQGLALRAA